MKKKNMISAKKDARVIKALLLLTMGMIFISCKKDQTISGSVVNAETEQGLDKVEILLTSSIKLGSEGGNVQTTSTNLQGDFSFTFKGNKKPSTVEISNLKDGDYYFVNGKKVTIANIESFKNLSFEVIPLKTVLLFPTDTLKAMSGESKTSIQISHRKAIGYYGDTSFVISTNNDAGGSGSVSSSIRMPMGWNLIKGNSQRQDGTNYSFVDSFYIGEQNINPIWNLKY